MNPQPKTCDGLGNIWGKSTVVTSKCPGCPACKPKTCDGSGHIVEPREETGWPTRVTHCPGCPACKPEKCGVCGKPDEENCDSDGSDRCCGSICGYHCHGHAPEPKKACKECQFEDGKHSKGCEDFKEPANPESCAKCSKSLPQVILLAGKDKYCSTKCAGIEPKGRMVSKSKNCRGDGSCGEPICACGVVPEPKGEEWEKSIESWLAWVYFADKAEGFEGRAKKALLEMNKVFRTKKAEWEAAAYKEGKDAAYAAMTNTASEALANARDAALREAEEAVTEAHFGVGFRKRALAAIRELRGKK